MLIPSRENIEKIFRIYQNQCSFHDCFKKIIDSDNHVNGNIIFVESNKKDHPRYNPNLTNLEMIHYTNLIMFCDVHCWEVQKEPDRFTGERLQTKLNDDLKNLPDGNFEFDDELYAEFLHHFVVYHDPDRFSHIRTYLPLYDDGAGDGGLLFDYIMCDEIYIKPTRHMAGGKFEIIDSSRKVREFDKVIFYSKEKLPSEGIQADIEISSTMRIDGFVPNIPKGDYFVSLISSVNEKSRFEKDLKFTVL